MPSTFACGLTGGKNEMACGDGGRVTVGKWTREDSAADEDEWERVRLRTLEVQFAESLRLGSVVTEEMDGRRGWDSDPRSGDGGDVRIVLMLVGEVESGLWSNRVLGGEDDAATVRGSRGESLAGYICP